MRLRKMLSVWLIAVGLPLLCCAQSGTITTVVGDSLPYGGALVNGVAVDNAGNLYFSDELSLVYKFTAAGTLSIFAGTLGNLGYAGDGGQAANALLYEPQGLAVDSAGNLYIADKLNNRVRKVAANGVITTIAGGGATGSITLGDGGPATQAILVGPQALALDSAGNIYVATTGDTPFGRIRKITTDGIIHTIAGGGYVALGDGGPATSASLLYPSGVAVDPAGNVYIADTYNNRIRKVSTSGIISTFAGNGAGSFSGDGGPAASAGMYHPQGVALDSAGNLYIAATGDNRVRVVNTGGTINTIAGNGAAAFSGDGGPAIDAELNSPYAVAISAQGVIYIADTFNYRVRAITGAAAANTISSGPYGFVPVTPCRILDTRNANGAFGGPEMAGNTTREFDVPSSSCQIPSNATAYSINVTVVPNGGLGYLSVWPTGQAQPTVSTLNSDGRVKANAAIVPAGTNGGIDIYVSDATHVIVDIDGYFTSGSSSALEFYPVTPCRIADTRNANGALGGPYLSGGQTRSFPVLQSGCGIPSGAQAYSLNFTAVPRAPIGFLSAWPTGQAQPVASVLNANTSTVTANAAIVPAGTNQGGVSVYSSGNTDLVVDINGYFAPAASGGLNLYTVPPCRIVDTRNPSGSSPFTGTLSVNVVASGCGAPSTAQAFVLNSTVVPTGGLGYLSLWPNGQSQPLVSTLNADPATVTSNMAIVPNTNGSVNAYASDPTWLILDIASYFAP